MIYIVLILIARLKVPHHYCSLLPPCVRIGQFARLLLPLEMVADSQAASPESNPNPLLPVNSSVVHYTTDNLIGLRLPWSVACVKQCDPMLYYDSPVNGSETNTTSSASPHRLYPCISRKVITVIHVYFHQTHYLRFTEPFASL